MDSAKFLYLRNRQDYLQKCCKSTVVENINRSVCIVTHILEQRIVNYEKITYQDLENILIFVFIAGRFLVQTSRKCLIQVSRFFHITAFRYIVVRNVFVLRITLKYRC